MALCFYILSLKYLHNLLRYISSIFNLPSLGKLGNCSASQSLLNNVPLCLQALQILLSAASI